MTEPFWNILSSLNIVYHTVRKAKRNAGPQQEPRSQDEFSTRTRTQTRTQTRTRTRTLTNSIFGGNAHVYSISTLVHKKKWKQQTKNRGESKHTTCDSVNPYFGVWLRVQGLTRSFRRPAISAQDDGKFLHPHRKRGPIFVVDGFFQSFYVDDEIFRNPRVLVLRHARVFFNSAYRCRLGLLGCDFKHGEA
jgi:hypothetical protein